MSLRDEPPHRESAKRAVYEDKEEPIFRYAAMYPLAILRVALRYKSVVAYVQHLLVDDDTDRTSLPEKIVNGDSNTIGRR
jgi:hypothetical protein